MELVHLGSSGLALVDDTGRLLVDPPEVADGPTVLTWTEAERVAGVRAGASGSVAAAPEVLAWLGIQGIPLGAAAVTLAGWSIRAAPYRPIPYATPTEALRKIGCALRSPLFALGRAGMALRRPSAAPLAVEVARGGRRVAFLGQALHRFTTATEHARLVHTFLGADVLVAGTDYDDEEATGMLLGAFGARTYVIADLTGPIRRRIGLPTRPLRSVLPTAPPGVHLLEEGGRIAL